MSEARLNRCTVSLNPAMSLIDAIGKRRSVRIYLDELVSDEAIDALL